MNCEITPANVALTLRQLALVLDSVSGATIADLFSLVLLAERIRSIAKQLDKQTDFRPLSWLEPSAN